MSSHSQDVSSFALSQDDRKRKIMTEYLKRHYDKEEEFLEEFYDAASAAGKILDEEWQPNPHCDDNVRKNQSHFLSTGELNTLVFDSASVFHDTDGFSFAQIHMKSSTRIVNIRIKNIDGKLVGEKLILAFSLLAVFCRTIRGALVFRTPGSPPKAMPSRQLWRMSCPFAEAPQRCCCCRPEQTPLLGR